MAMLTEWHHTSTHCRRRTAAILVVALATVAAPVQAQSSTYEQLQTFSTLLSQIRLNYVDSVTTAHLVRGAISGMLASLDPHSYFLAHDDAIRLDAWRAGHLAATGIRVDEADGAIVVQSVYPRSPAARSGVTPGDRIIALNDSAVTGLSAEAIQSRLIGERGSRVGLLLERGLRFEPETVSVQVRNEEIRPQTVSIARTIGDGIGYVRLDQFLPETSNQVRDAAAHVMQGRPRRLILDIRGNPGGLVEAAVQVAALFLRRGQLVFSTTGRRRYDNHEYRTERDGELQDVDLLVLIDEHSASAAEALAGSLQDHDRALIVGRRSFGKALMQSMFLVPPNDDAVWLTVGYVLTPAGRLIQRRYRGLSTTDYERQAGRSGAAEDTLREFQTDAGRVVRGGGGIRPDTALSAPAPLPVWWVAAADSGFLTAVADSVANSLGTDLTARQSWIGTPGDWQVRLLQPVLARVRQRLGVRADIDSAVASRMGRLLAARVAEVRWGVEAEDEILVSYDADVRTAVQLFPRIRSLLISHH
jgi:carboxyl-terminal processing protease